MVCSRILSAAVMCLLSFGALAEDVRPVGIESPVNPSTSAVATPANAAPITTNGDATKAPAAAIAATASEPTTAASARAPDSQLPTEQTHPSTPLPEAMSPWSMFVKADVVVKAVMIGLALASVATWTVLLVKTVQLRAARREGRRALATILSARSLLDATRNLADQTNAAFVLLAAAEDEVEKSRGLPADGIKERVAWQLERIEAAAAQRIGRGMGVLATVGAVAPFVGLFGTVWGIMNSFIGISQAHTTNLAVVAPGIAEALLATAFGLVAAIPAVVIYNAFARSTGSYRSVLADSSVAILRLLSRDLDRSSLPINVRRSPRAEATVLSIADSAE